MQDCETCYESMAETVRLDKDVRAIDAGRNTTMMSEMYIQ